MSVRIFYRPMDIHHRQHHEDDGLDDADQEAQYRHNQRGEERDKGKEHHNHDFMTADIAEETERKREHPAQVSDYLDKKDHPCQPPDRSEEVFNIAESVLLHADHMGSGEDDDCQCRGRVEIAGGRVETRNQAYEV